VVITWQSYHFKAFTKAGELVEGDVDARSPEEALDDLWARGLTPLKATSNGQPAPWWQREISWSSAPDPKVLTAFIREFAVLSEAGLPIDSIIKILIQQSRSRPMEDIGRQVLAAVTGGASLSDAWSKFPRSFGAECISLLRAGERRGSIAGALAEIADLLEQRLAIREKIRSALIYPCALICMSVVSIGVILSTLVPSIAPLFSQNDNEPPFIIEIFLRLQAQWTLIVAVGASLACLIGFAIVFAAHRPEVRLRFDTILLQLPIIGSLVIHYNTERFSRTLGALLSSGVPMNSAFTGACEVCRNRHLANQLHKAHSALQNGSSLANSLEKNTDFPEIVSQMAAVGEASGKLAQMLSRAGVNSGQIVQRRLERLMTLLTPALTIGVASLIGGLVFATMSAILSINDMALR